MLEGVKKVLELVKKDQEAAKQEKKEDKVVSDRTIENVVDLNDRFNRARYMDEDDK